jgi:D-lactate dehydrogenase
MESLDNGILSGYATDVFEREGGIFYRDHDDGKVKDPVLESLINHPKVLLTPHQAFATHEGLRAIARMLFETLSYWDRGQRAPNEL